MDNTWGLNIRQGWIWGLALAVILIGATVGLVVAAVVAPLSLRVFLLGLGACLTLGLTIRVLYQLWGLIHGSYELDRNALTIHWGPVEHQIPMGSVQEVLSGADLEKVRMQLNLRWPGYRVGLGRGWVNKTHLTDPPPDSGDEQPSQAPEGAPGTAPEGASGTAPEGAPGTTPEGASGQATEPPPGTALIDPIIFYAAASLKQQVIVRTANVAYAISPADLEGFMTAFRERLTMGPTQEIEERSTHPGFVDWSIWRDRLGLLLLGGSALLLVLLVGVLCWRFPYLPTEIALRFNAAGEPLLVSPARRIFYLALLGTGFFVINSGAGLFFYHRERPISYFLWSGLLATLSSLWAAVISILLMQ